MRAVIHILMLSALLTAVVAAPAMATWREKYEVFGVQDPDMLKMRAGPGTGFVVIVGLPNGAVVRIESCQLIGGTRWCKVFLEQAPGLRGYVSSTYLREKPGS
jgi:uncharacterized protein YraI